MVARGGRTSSGDLHKSSQLTSEILLCCCCWCCQGGGGAASQKEGGRRNYKEKEQQEEEEGAMEQAIDKEALLGEKLCNWFTVSDWALLPTPLPAIEFSWLHLHIWSSSSSSSSSSGVAGQSSSMRWRNSCCCSAWNRWRPIVEFDWSTGKQTGRQARKLPSLTNSQGKQRSMISSCHNQQWHTGPPTCRRCSYANFPRQN